MIVPRKKWSKSYLYCCTLECLWIMFFSAFYSWFYVNFFFKITTTRNVFFNIHHWFGNYHFRRKSICCLLYSFKTDTIIFCWWLFLMITQINLKNGFQEMLRQSLMTLALANQWTSDWGNHWIFSIYDHSRVVLWCN